MYIYIYVYMYIHIHIHSIFHHEPLKRISPGRSCGKLEVRQGPGGHRWKSPEALRARFRGSAVVRQWENPWENVQHGPCLITGG